MSQYVTVHQGLASLLAYTLGDAAHRSTRVDGCKPTFTFDDPEDRCSTMARAFFAPGGAGVADARGFLRSVQAVRATYSAALKAGGEWTNNERN